MAKPIKVMAGEHPVEAAIREGRIPESRRDHYLQLMASKPKKTAKLLAKLEPVLEPQEEMEAVREFVRGGAQQAQSLPAVESGPSDYPEEWLTQTGRRGASGSISFEDAATAAQAGAADQF
jgi:hypothetical protein